MDCRAHCCCNTLSPSEARAEDGNLGHHRGDPQFLLSGMMAVGGPLQGYKTRTITVHLSKDDPLPYRVAHCGNVTRMVLLLSPSGFKKGMDYMVTQGTWSPSLIVHLVGLMDILRDTLCCWKKR